LMSNVVFDDGNIGAIFAIQQIFSTSQADATVSLMFSRLNQEDNVINWCFHLTPTSQTIDTSTYPFLM
jgi:hypothetical protein